MLGELAAALISAAAAGAVTDLLTRRLEARLRQRGVVGVDIHKPDRPEVPEGAGFAVFAGVSVGAALLWTLTRSAHSVGFVGAAAVGALIGALDDRVDLGGVLKPALTLGVAAPLIAAGSLNPRPLLPLLGRARLFIAINALVPAYAAVVTNAVNMYDALNGMMPLSVAIACGAMAVIGALTGGIATTQLALVLAVALLAYYRYNRYPARVFSGNVGSLSIGAALSALPVYDGLEAFLLIAMLPFMVSGFFLLSSVGGLRERRQIVKRPVLVDSNGLIRANPDPAAPITLISILTLDRPKSEPEVVREAHLLTGLSALLAVLTLLALTPGW